MSAVSQLVSSSSSEEEGVQPSKEGVERSHKKVARFTTAQMAFMNAYYDQAMKGTGKQYSQPVMLV